MVELEAVDGDKLQDAKQKFAQVIATPVETTDAPPKIEPKEPETVVKRTRTRKTTATPKADDKKTEPNADELYAKRSEGIAGLFQMAAAGCLIASQKSDSVPLKADAITLANAAPIMGDAVAKTAAENAEFAKIVDKITAAGPYAALITASLSLGAQLARNHGMKMGEMFGAVPPEQVLASLQE